MAKPEKCNSDLPGDTDGGKGIGATGKELPFAQQQHPDVVLTLLLHTHANMHLKLTSFAFLMMI